MNIIVKVSANTKQPNIRDDGGGAYSVKVDAPAKDGKANARLAELLAEYFGVSKSSVIIQKGKKSSIKRVEIIQKN